MVIDLSVEQERLVRSLVEGGRYGSGVEVVDEALRLFQAQDDRVKLDEIRCKVAVSVEQFERGEEGPFDPIGTLARVRARRVEPAESS